jgi:subtilisin
MIRSYRAAALTAVLFASAIAAAAAPPVAPNPRKAPGRITLPPSEQRANKVYTGLDVTEESVDWGISNLNVPTAWKTAEGAGVKVAVLDTGIDSQHKDLVNQILMTKDFTNSATGTNDRVGHGTHCAGVIAAELNGWGMCGVARKSKIIAVKVLDDTGSGTVDNIAAGIDWATAQGADVISMSLGGPQADTFMPPALVRAQAAGVIVVAAAGNEGPNENTVGYPGGYPQCIAIAAIDPNSNVASFSSRGPAVFAAGPGVNVRSCYPGPGDGLFATMSGTSMATPHFAGLAAIWISANPTVAKKDRPAKFRAALQAACTDLPPAGRDTATGYGRPDAVKLLPNVVVTPLPPATPAAITFTLDDFTASGKQKLQLLNPKLGGITFPIVP